MKVNNCYHCGSTESSYYAEENGFTLVKCKNCGLLYSNARPDNEQISESHRQGKHSGTEELDVTGRFSTKKVAKYSNILNDLYPKGIDHLNNWLDVGCGHGEFILAVTKFSNQKIKSKGTEPNVKKQESAAEHDLDVSFFDLNTHKDKYDAISLLNVYSHLPNPPEFIALLKTLLNPNGELILETGDIADFSSKDIYKPFHLPDHLSFASEKILVDMLEKLGFEMIEIKKYPYVELNLETFTKELIKVFLPSYQSRFKYYLNWNKYSKTDIYIRAKLK